MDQDKLDQAAASFARVMKMPLDAMEGYFVLHAFSGGRKVFNATDEELSTYMLGILQSGRLQKLFRMTAWREGDEEWKEEVERYISQLEEEIFGEK